MKLYLNILKFESLQGKISNTKLANMMNVSRSQIWRAKSGEPVGQKFIAGFKDAFPRESIDEFFLAKPLKRSDTSNITA